MISNKSIIEPEVQKPGIPIKKSTLAAIVAAMMGSAVITAFVMQSATGGVKAEPTAEKPAAQTGEVGGASAIDEESKKADRAQQLALAALRGQQDPKTGTGGGAQSAKDCVQSKDASGPVPPCLRRDGNEAALGERAVGIAGGNPGNRSAQSQAGQQQPGARIDPAVEQDAQARQSKSLAFDMDAGPGSAATSNPRNDGGMMNTGLGFTPVTRAPSADLQPQIDAALAAAKAGNTAQKTASTQRAWLNEYASEGGSAEKHQVSRSYPTASQFTLHQGKIIPATLGRKLNSDLPGTVTAYTTVDVYDSLGKGHLLIPKGSSLVGRYDSDVKIGQERVMFAFQRIILPSGQSFDLPAAQGSDLSGAAGGEGDVNNHFFKMFASSFLVAWVADRVQQPQATTLTGGTTTSPAGQVLVDVAHSILDRNKNIAPTITLEQGTRINVEVARDMEFNGPYIRSKN